ncbi:MAG: 3,4-dihydroxy-2-butanone-4-phosphate synthase [Puniceicoccaceae bacterium]
MSSGVFDSVEDAIEAIAAGMAIIVTDDEDRENEGDLIFAASKVRPELVNMMIRYGSGIVCVPMLPHALAQLGISQMVSENRESQRTDYSVSVDAAEGITTGISAFDRARTISILGNPEATADQLVQPGHVFPLRAKPGGVLQRAGHTEAAVDLAALAGLFPAGVICEIVNEDGTMARLPELVAFKERHGLRMISIADLIDYRRRREVLVRRMGSFPFETRWGAFELHVFSTILDERRHFALTLGRVGPEPTLVRVHSENVLADLFGAGSEGGGLLSRAMEVIAEEGSGVFLYIEQLFGGVRLEGEGSAAVLAGPKMDARDYGIGAQILRELGLRKIRLLTSQARKVVALTGYGLEIVDQIEV